MMDPFDHIQDYVQGKLSEKELQAFNTALAVNPDLQLAVKHADTLSDINNALIEEEVLQAFSDQKDKKLKGQILGWGILVLVLIVLALSAYKYINRSRSIVNQQNWLAEVYYEPAWPVFRSSVTDTVEQWVQKYLQGNQDIAKDKLRDLNTAESKYWLSEIYLKEEKADSILLYLPSDYSSIIRRDRLNYLRVLAVALKNDKKDLDTLIDSMPKDTDIFYKRVYDQF